VTEISLRPESSGFDLFGRAWSSATSPRADLFRRVGLALVLIIVAYHYSLETILQSLTTQTPLAYLGLVPIFALLLAVCEIKPRPGEPAIHDRQIDYIIGLPLLIGALAFNIIGPVRLSTMFWLWRLDIVTLPLFTAGVIALVFGTRVMWRLKVPILFLILAWPLPYSTFLVNWLNAFTNTTLAALNVALHIVHVAKALPSQGVGVYLVNHGRTGFQVGIVSACSGVNGFVGYALVAVAFLVVVRGGWFGKALWLGLGLVAVWLSNVARIVIILVVGHLWGETLAIDVLHPVMGLVTFNLVVLGMMLTLRRFGLDVAFLRNDRGASVAKTVRSAVPRLGLASAVLVAFVVVAAFANSSLRSYDLVEGALGEPRLASYTALQSAPAGWSAVHTDTYTWATPFFGEDSTWLRYELTWTGATSAPLQARTPVIADVITTSDLSSFSAYGIEACYRFHGYKLYSIKTVNLGNGVYGNALSYYNTSIKSDWTTVYWIWPVLTSTGKTRYERVVLMMVNSGAVRQAGKLTGPSVVGSVGLGVQNALSGTTTTGAKLTQTRSFLIQFAQSLIASHATLSSTVVSSTAERGSPSTTAARPKV
jgi:exosortase/archaeosortase family protein